eukprot:scaffold7867_cov77-Cyclotella_meneghiniana.AAC.6
MRAHINAQIDKSTSNETHDATTSSQHETIEPQVAALDVPIEMPEVRINLASLVEPPLMSSWLPTEEVEK